MCGSPGLLSILILMIIMCNILWLGHEIGGGVQGRTVASFWALFERVRPSNHCSLFTCHVSAEAFCSLTCCALSSQAVQEAAVPHMYGADVWRGGLPSAHPPAGYRSREGRVQCDAGLWQPPPACHGESGKWWITAARRGLCSMGVFFFFTNIRLVNGFQYHSSMFTHSSLFVIVCELLESLLVLTRKILSNN